MPEIIIKRGDQIVQKYYLYKDAISIGRAPENEISIENLAVSRRHAEIRQQDGTYVLEDLDSANGTFVNGVQVTRTEIYDKDVIGIGKHKLYFYDQQAGSLEGAEKTMLLTRPTTTKAVLRVVRGKQKDQIFPLKKVENRIGRAADNDIRLSDWFVSKYHAEIIRRGMVYVIRDLGSWRHTHVNGQIVEEQALKPGDEIQFGPKIAVLFEVKDGTSAREGSGRRPVELEGADLQPLPLAGSHPNTPLPIAGSAAYGSGRSASGAEDERSELQGAAENGSFGDESGDSREAGNAQGRLGVANDWHAQEEYAKGAAESASEFEGSEFEMESVRLDDQGDADGAGWDEAGELAAEAVIPLDGDEGQANEAEASDGWESRSGAGEGDEALDAVSIEAEEEVEWIDSIGEEEEDRQAALSDTGGGEVPVASLDSPGLESPAAFDEESGDQAPAEVEGYAEPVTSGVAGESMDSEACGEMAGEEAPLLEGSTLVEAILERHAESKSLDRTEIEMWVKALRNPSKVIRKQAQRQLQKLTGQVYDIEL
jgi:pSer/pThr/pTyr-binding forkhead associated (FHA) protein